MKYNSFRIYFLNMPELDIEFVVQTINLNIDEHHHWMVDEKEVWMKL